MQNNALDGIRGKSRKLFLTRVILARPSELRALLGRGEQSLLREARPWRRPFPEGPDLDTC